MISFWKRPRFNRCELDVKQLAQVPGFNNLFDFPNWSTVEESVTHHKRQLPPLSNVDQLSALGRRSGHRFFYISMLSGKQALLSHLKVQPNRSGYGYRIQSFIFQELLKVGCSIDLGIDFRHTRQAVGIAIGYVLYAALGKRPEIPDKVWAPITASDYCQIELVHCIASFSRRKIQRSY